MFLSGTVAVLLVAATPARAGDFYVKVTGSPATKFRGDCRIANAAGNMRRFKLRGSIPRTYWFKANSVSCTVQKWDAQGRLRVQLLRGIRHVARATTAAAFNWVKVRSSGPWGKARAVRGNQPTINFKSNKHPIVFKIKKHKFESNKNRIFFKFKKHKFKSKKYMAGVHARTIRPKKSPFPRPVWATNYRR